MWFTVFWLQRLWINSNMIIMIRRCDYKKCWKFKVNKNKLNDVIKISFLLLLKILLKQKSQLRKNIFFDIHQVVVLSVINLCKQREHEVWIKIKDRRKTNSFLHNVFLRNCSLTSFIYFHIISCFSFFCP